MIFDNMQILSGVYRRPDHLVSIITPGKNFDVDEADIIKVPMKELKTIFVSETPAKRIILYGPAEKLYEFDKRIGVFDELQDMFMHQQKANGGG